MLLQIDSSNRIGERVALRAMFAARKRVFVDLLKWDIPVIDGRFEIDQFDREQARYIILMEGGETHLASARLLPTTAPGILDTLYPQLSTEPLPAGADVFEITRFCLTPDGTSARRRRIRDDLVVALARYALEAGIKTYTGVADLRWYQQIAEFGWDCRQLGPARDLGTTTLVALRIDITPDVLERLAAHGICASAVLASRSAEAA